MNLQEAIINQLRENVEWSYFNKFKPVLDKYMPGEGEGDTLASQIATCVNKLVYKWYNDGDVYDNVNSSMEGWANDLSSYANWLYNYCDRAVDILDRIYRCKTDDDYEDILKDLADKCLNEKYISKMEQPKEGSIYKCNGPFEFREFSEGEDEDWEDYTLDYEYEEDEDTDLY